MLDRSNQAGNGDLVGIRCGRAAFNFGAKAVATLSMPTTSTHDAHTHLL